MQPISLGGALSTNKSRTSDKKIQKTVRNITQPVHSDTQDNRADVCVRERINGSRLYTIRGFGFDMA